MKNRMWLYAIGITLLAATTLFLIGCPASSTNPTSPSSSADFVGVWHQVAEGVQFANETVGVQVDQSSQVLTILADGHFTHTHIENSLSVFESGRYIYAAPLLRVFVDSVSVNSQVHAGDTAHFNVLSLDASSMVFDSVGGSYLHQWSGFIRTGLSGATIGGVAYGSANVPVANATIHATLGTTTNTATSNSWGFFFITGLSAGSWSVVGTSGASTSNPVSVTTTATGIFPVGLSITVTNTTVGTIHGFVRDVNTQVAIANATVSTDSGGPSTTSSNNGEYTIAGATARFTNVTVTATNYQASYATLYVSAGDTVPQNFYLAATNAADGRAYGDITNALNGNLLSGVTVTTIPSGQSTITNAAGHYSFAIHAGTRALIATKTGFSSVTRTIERVVSNDSVQQSFSLTQQLTTGRMRFVLSWAANPSDLDSHLLTPYTSTAGEVWYGGTGDSSSAPYATLDHDVVSGSGPETITIYQWTTGTYKYFVKRYAGSPGITGSQAVVNVYDASGLVRQLSVPTTGTGDWWVVCTIDGTTHAITFINQITDVSPGGSGDKVGTTVLPKKTPSSLQH